MDKGTVVELTITDMTDDGKGIGHIDGLTVFVDGSIPGDTVRGKIVQDKKRNWRKSSPRRRTGKKRYVRTSAAAAAAPSRA